MKRTVAIMIIIVVAVFVLVRCVGNGNEKAKQAQTDDSKFKAFAGSKVCASCHNDIYNKHIYTEHHLTSAPASEVSILGSFKDGSNVFPFDFFTNVAMEKRDSGLYQVEYVNQKEIRKGKFDIVVGSGRKGQSYLSWLHDRLVQLPITYFSPVDQWSNSPGYYPDRPMFYRPITSRCLECHSTYFQNTPDTSKILESFDHRKFILGVECEKCHGPAAAHVEFQQANPTSTEAKYIVNPGKLARERLLDLCALCHGGKSSKIKPSFTFQVGDTLSNYFTFSPPDPNVANIDVHGNQLGLLELSKCFTIGKVTCINCHDVHQNENAKLAVFSQRCMTCHSAGHEKTCKMTATAGPMINQDCIDCHMPKQSSLAITVYLQHENDPTPAKLRTHYITVYPDETKKVMAYLNQIKSEKKQSKE